MVLILAACGGGPAELPQVQDVDTEGLSQEQRDALAVSQEQREAMADGEVTYDEYQAGFHRFSACLEEAGYHLVDVADEGRVMSFGVPEAAVLDGTETWCYFSEFKQVDMAWQLTNEDVSKTAG